MKFTLLLLSLLSFSCNDPKAKGQLEETKKSFASPEEIGILPDGRKIFLVKRSMGATQPPHSIYFIGSSVTVNQTVNAGKTTTNRVKVLVEE